MRELRWYDIMLLHYHGKNLNLKEPLASQILPSILRLQLNAARFRQGIVIVMLETLRPY